MNEGKNLNFIASTVARLRTSDAADVLREAILRIYDTRHMAIFGSCLDATARWLIATGDLDAGTLVYGHLEAHYPPWDNPFVRRGRQEGLRLVSEHPNHERLMARGAALSREELVRFLAEQLLDHPT